nr:TRAP transporter large permease subunit [uncultured Roseobacter sp.]
MIIIGSLTIVCMMLLLGVSVYVAFGAVLVFIALVGDQSITGYLPTGATGIRSLVLLAIPLFMIAGGVMEKGKIAAPLVALAELFIGHIKGGLSAAAVLACGVFGSISGAANATLTCIGAIMMPHLKQANYPRGQSAALIVCASPLGLLIPPSSSHILYGWVAQQHVLKCFLSTVIPAFILITLLIITNQFMLRKHDNIELKERPKPFLPTLGRQGRLAGPALMMPIIILGGIYGGIMTPTEAAGIAVVYAIPVAIYFYRGLTWKTLAKTIQTSGITIGVVMTV